MAGKKSLIVFVFLVLLLLLCTYIFFPEKQQAGGTIKAATPYSLALRQLPDTVLWKLWWPWAVSGNKGSQSQGKINLKGISETHIMLNWEENSVSIPVILSLASNGNDSTVMNWSATWDAGNNPFVRIIEFARGKRLRNDMQTLVASFSLYASNPELTYGFKPVFIKVTDTLLISTKSTFSTEPGIKEMYGMFGSLEKFVAAKGATVTGEPMYHVTPLDMAFEVMVALPVSNLIEESATYRIKRMVDGHLMTAEVNAGPEKLKWLFGQFELYKNDHQLVSPAIPYLQPITNRLQNPDTAQWVTRMCYPIF